MVSVGFKSLAMPNVDFEMRFSSVDMEYEQFKPPHTYLVYWHGAHIICLSTLKVPNVSKQYIDT